MRKEEMGRNGKWGKSIQYDVAVVYCHCFAFRDQAMSKATFEHKAKQNKWFVCPNKEMKKRGSVGRFFLLLFLFLPKNTLRRKHDRISLLYVCKHISLL